MKRLAAWVALWWFRPVLLGIGGGALFLGGIVGTVYQNEVQQFLTPFRVFIGLMSVGGVATGIGWLMDFRAAKALRDQLAADVQKAKDAARDNEDRQAKYRQEVKAEFEGREATLVARLQVENDQSTERLKKHFALESNAISVELAHVMSLHGVALADKVAGFAELQASLKAVLTLIEKRVVRVLGPQFDNRVHANIMLAVERPQAHAAIQMAKEKLKVEYLNPYAKEGSAKYGADLLVDDDEAEYFLILVTSGRQEAARQIFLRVPIDSAKLLPGAPLALRLMVDELKSLDPYGYKELKLDDIADTHNIGEHKFGIGAPKQTRSAVEAYFKKLKQARSLLSIGLAHRRASGGFAVGVMNINSEEPGLHQDPQVQQQIHASIRPFLPMAAGFANALRNELCPTDHESKAQG